MKVLVTGANGMLAKAVVAECKTQGDQVTALSREEMDISRPADVDAIVSSEKPEILINCAAKTDVDGCESKHEECYAVNSVGPENLAMAAKKIGCVLVTVSTDYVFDGVNVDFYTQRDTPNPLGVYAKAKLEGEFRARSAYARTIVVRAGWIFGHGGKNFLSVMGSLLGEGKTIKAIHDSFGTPTFANDLAKRLREYAILDLPLTYHAANSGNGASFADFAAKICELKGYDQKLIEKVSMDDLIRPAPRPPSSKLACLFSEKLGLPPLRHWEKALEEFISEKP